MSETSTDLVLPVSGEIINLDDAQAVVRAMREVNRLQSELYDAKRVMAAALIEHATKLGLRTVTLPNGEKFVREGGPRKQYRPDEVEAGLRAAGMPEERIAQIVKEQVTWTVNGTEANKAAKANPEYAAVLEAASQLVDEPYKVKLG